jgi:hypothetical protein
MKAMNGAPRPMNVLAPRELSRVGGEALALPSTSDHPVCVANHLLRLTVEITGA